MVGPVVEARNGSVVHSVVSDGSAAGKCGCAPADSKLVSVINTSSVVVDVVGGSGNSRAGVAGNVGVARNTASALGSNSNLNLIACAGTEATEASQGEAALVVGAKAATSGRA